MIKSKEYMFIWMSEDPYLGNENDYSKKALIHKKASWSHSKIFEKFTEILSEICECAQDAFSWMPKCFFYESIDIFFEKLFFQLMFSLICPPVYPDFTNIIIMPL